MALRITEQQTAEQQCPGQQTAEQTEACCGSSRRVVLRAAGVGAAAASIGLTAAACSSSSSGTSSPAGSQNNAAGGGSSASASASSDSGSGSGSALAQTTDIPVDGGKILNADGGIVITQPSSGTFKAFSATCTHSGCTVGAVSDNQITCPCHGSVFSAKDGSVVNGPARAPLPAKNIKVSGSQIFLA